MWNVLNIFLASPSDVNEERRLAKQQVDSFNDDVAHELNWHVELLGWEDTLPGSSRPQDRINQDLDRCDVFVGVLWKRWGQPTGEYSSGFEEEFRRSKSSAASTSVPEIWLYLKHIQEADRADAGPQLTNVLEFRLELQTANDLMYKEFETAADFASYFRSALSKTIIAKAKLEVSEPANSQKEPETSAYDETDVSQGIEARSSLQFASALIDDPSALHGSPTPYWSIVRSHIAATSLYSAIHGGELLDVHATAMAYKQRLEWSYTDMEQQLLIRSFIGGHYSTTPGWFWLSKEANAEEILVPLALEDRNYQVRTGAYFRLSHSDFEVSEKLALKALSEQNNATLKYAVSFASKCATPAIREKLRELADRSTSDVASAAKESLIRVAYQIDKADGINTLIEVGTLVSAEIGKQLREDSAQIDPETLASGLSAGAESVRELFAELLYERELVDEEISKRLLADSSSGVRKFGFKAEVDRGVRFDFDQIKIMFPEKKGLGILMLAMERYPVADDLIEYQLESLTEPELMTQATKGFEPANLAFKVLASSHFENNREYILSEVENEFEPYFRRLTEEIEGVSSDQDLLAKFRRLVPILQSDMILGTLRGLKGNVDPELASISTKYLSHETSAIRVAALELLERNPNKDLTETLLELARDSSTSWNEAEKAVVALLASGCAPEIIANEIPEQRLGIFAKPSLVDALVTTNTTEARAALVRLLGSDVSTLREEAIRGICSLYSKDEATQVLNEYQDSETYYYDVVRTFDDYIYNESSIETDIKWYSW